MIIDEVHNRSAHSDYVLALTLAAMQKNSDLRLVLMSATGDHNLVCERIPHCQQLVMKAIMHKVKRCFLEQPLDRSTNLLNQMAQFVVTYHNEKVGRPLIDETCHSKGVNVSNKIMVFLPGLAQIFQFCELLHEKARVPQRMWKQCSQTQQWLPLLRSTHWVRIRVCLLLSPFRRQTVDSWNEECPQHEENKTKTSQLENLVVRAHQQ